MKKRIVVLFLVTALVAVGAWSVFADSSPFKVIGKDPIFRAEGDVIIKGPTADQLSVEDMDREKANKILETLLQPDQKLISFDYDGITYKFAEQNGQLYNVPLENSPPLLISEKYGTFFAANDSIFKISKNHKSLEKVSSDEYEGINKEELSGIEGRGFFWISSLAISNDGNTLFYTSNRRELATKADRFIADLWKIDLSTGMEEMVAEDVIEVLYDEKDYLILSRGSGIDQPVFTVFALENGKEKTLIESVDGVYGSDKHFIYYRDQSLSVNKYDIKTGAIETLFNERGYSSGGVSRSPDREASYINVLNHETLIQSIFYTDESGTNQIEFPKGYRYSGLYWKSDHELLITGYLDREDNIVNYLLDIDTYKGKAGDSQ